MFQNITFTIFLEIVILCYTATSSRPNEFQKESNSPGVLAAFEEDFLTHDSILDSKTSEPGIGVFDKSHYISGLAQTFFSNNGNAADTPLKHTPVDEKNASFSTQDTSIKVDSSKPEENQTYSVNTPLGIDRQPLLSGNTNHLIGYKANPQPNSLSIRPYDVPVRHDSSWIEENPKRTQFGMQWTRNSYWDSRRMDRHVTDMINPYGSHDEMSPNGIQGKPQGSEQNQELVREILTKALDILTLEPSETMIGCQDDKGLAIPCKRSSFGKPNKSENNSKPCLHGTSDRTCQNVLNYYRVFGPWLRKHAISQSDMPRKRDMRSGSVEGFVFNQSHDMPQPRTRTVFRSVEASPSSSLARLLNPDNSISDARGSGTGSSTTGSGNANSGGTSNNNNDNNGGSGASGISGSGNVGTALPVGVDLNMFNKFARDVVSFEQRSATEIKRLDNLLRQLAMAAQTDFTSVSTSVNTLQQELLRTQQQLVQAWSILNATHVKDNQQTTGDLHDVKTDVYRLHALITGATPLGQSTAEGRAAEVKEVATVGPRVDCAALYKSGVNTSGVYDLQPQPTDNGTRMTAFCDMETEGGGWTLFQRRRDGSDDFFRGWNSYKHGFGSYKHDHWLGLENIHLLTKYGDNVMRIEVTDWDNKTRWAEFRCQSCEKMSQTLDYLVVRCSVRKLKGGYEIIHECGENFKSYTRIMGESDGYRILVGGYRGTAGDPFHSLSYSMRMQSMRFSTFDSDNDLDSGGNCALTFTSGWWFNKCFQVNLNGVWYGNSRYAGPSMNGIVWDLWPEHFNGYSLKHTEMKLRPADFLNKQ